MLSWRSYGRTAVNTVSPARDNASTSCMRLNNCSKSTTLHYTGAIKPGAIKPTEMVSLLHRHVAFHTERCTKATTDCTVCQYIHLPGHASHNSGRNNDEKVVHFTSNQRKRFEIKVQKFNITWLHNNDNINFILIWQQQ